MLDEDKQRLNHILLVLTGILLIINLIVLDILFFVKPNVKIVSPSELKADDNKTINNIPKQEEIDSAGKIETSTYYKKTDDVNFRLFCQEEISKALATISAQKKETVKIADQQVSLPTQLSTIYIPLGGGVSTTNSSWDYPGGAEAYFNKDDYQQAKKISFEVFLKVKHGAGDANARLYDATNQVVISESEVLSGKDIFVLSTSPALNLLNGNNLYQVQLRSTSGYEAFMDGARLKVEY